MTDQLIQLIRLTDTAAHAYTNARLLVFDQTSSLNTAVLSARQRQAINELDRAEDELNRFRMAARSRAGR